MRKANKWERNGFKDEADFNKAVDKMFDELVAEGKLTYNPKTKEYTLTEEGRKEAEKYL